MKNVLKSFENQVTNSYGAVKSGFMKKMVTAMKKDSILHEYQYFVGGGASISFADNDLDAVSNEEDELILRVD